MTSGEARAAGRTPPPVAGVYETALYVADLPRAYAFYRDLFGFEAIGSEVGTGDRLAALRVGDRQVLLLFRYGASAVPPTAAGRATGGRVLHHDARGQMHVAFAVAYEDLGAWERRLQARGIAIERAIDWRPGVRSLYVRDPDGHLVELATPGVWGVV
ncbi:MAG: VOC family protein [Chloroflexi bacterium]|nr:VOC family protein [Chloroflexota bacterium]